MCFCPFYQHTYPHNGSILGKENIVYINKEGTVRLSLVGIRPYQNFSFLYVESDFFGRTDNEAMDDLSR